VKFPHPLVVAPNAFVAGTWITFRVYVASVADVVNISPSYSEITVLANSPPTGGYLLVNSTSGDALFTDFQLMSNSWIDDPSDYSLTYEFKFKSAASQPALNLQSRSPQNTVTTNPSRSTDIRQCLDRVLYGVRLVSIWFFSESLDHCACESQRECG
jgi:hypothetical protein